LIFSWLGGRYNSVVFGFILFTEALCHTECDFFAFLATHFFSNSAKEVSKKAPFRVAFPHKQR